MSGHVCSRNVEHTCGISKSTPRFIYLWFFNIWPYHSFCSMCGLFSLNTKNCCESRELLARISWSNHQNQCQYYTGAGDRSDGSSRSILALVWDSNNIDVLKWGHPANTKRWTNVGMLAHRLRLHQRWPNMKPTLVQLFVFAGSTPSVVSLVSVLIQYLGPHMDNWRLPNTRSVSNSFHQNHGRSLPNIFRCFET